MTESVSFAVGEKYENMKGVFEVLAIHRDSMEIRWEDGEEISTSIALQQRIIERMKHEKELNNNQKDTKTQKSKSGPAKATNVFQGLVEDDFSATVNRTVWRGRGQLGGAVTKRIRRTPFKFNSWAVTGHPEVHWLDLKRQKQPDTAAQAKFYARLENDSFCFGFDLPKAVDTGAKGRSDWQNVIAWLKDQQNEMWLNHHCESFQLVLHDVSGQAISGTLTASGNRWVQHHPDGEERVLTDLAGFLTAAEQYPEPDLRVEKRMEKAAVLEKGMDIAVVVAALFDGLMPLYEAAAGRKG